MALTGLDIYKLLPKTNCKQCGQPTCLAFAMKLSQKQAELAACPFVSDQAKQALEAASRPPIRLVTVGSEDGRKIEVGNETAMFRHEKTFFHEPGFVIRIKDTSSPEEIAKTAAAVAGYAVERVGMGLRVSGVAIDNASKDSATFLKAIGLVKSAGELSLVIMSTDSAIMEAALAKVGSSKPLIYAATRDNAAQMAALALKFKCPVAVSAEGIEAVTTLAEEVNKAGVEDIVLDPGTRGFADSLVTITQLRRLALKKNFRPAGYPIITFPGEKASSPEEETLLAGQHVAKYAGIIVLESFDPARIYPLLTLRQNIYTDPQKPIQMQPGLYPIGEPGPSSPLYVTTNFSLTYFSVAGEVEGSGLPSWLLVADSEGLSVLTAWAAGKFDAEKIAKSTKASGIADKITHRKIIIPGHVATLRGELEDELSGWQIMVGPREAVDIPSFIKRTWKD
ncbi:MAG: acetyl-CoA decarbonylase/synthase complex subunit gamma [Dehalococcoidia bacterium]|nr:acetyl-CoA decarbonylase/synthase complex subunit gamma [Dehalococcoidia bacterium]